MLTDNDSYVKFLDLGAALANGLEPPAQLLDGLLYEEQYTA